MPRYRKKPLAHYEFGTRIYAPSGGERRYRVVTVDLVTGQRVFHKFTDEDDARAKARELEQFLATATPIRNRPHEGPRTLDRLAVSYQEDHLAGLSLRYQQRQEYLLRRWILPRLATKLVSAWTPAESAAVIAAVRAAGGSDALVQDVGATMRSLVTHARRLRWLTAQSQDPMWMVRYVRTSTIQGAASVYVLRSTLPTDDQCDALFTALEELGHARWGLAMRLVARTGLRWGELVALQAGDIDFQPRVVHVRRAVEQGSSGPATLKTPKNGKTRTTIYPRSLEPDLRRLVTDTRQHGGPTGLVFPNRAGGFARRSSFQPIWVRAADAAGWPMTSPLRRTAGYGEKNKGWRWTGAAQWTPHDLRHVAACWMLFDLGLDPAIVADKLGHADPAFTIRRYIGIRGNPDTTAMTLTDQW
jgi:integrase